MSKIHSKVIALALISAGLVAHAGEVIVHIASYHTPSTYDTYYTTNYSWGPGYEQYNYSTTTTTEHKYNNFNPGVGYRTDDGWSVGAYYNSYQLTSLYVGKNFNVYKWIGVNVGVATGYSGHGIPPDNWYEIRPYALLEAKIPVTDIVSVLGGYAPRMGQYNPVGTFHVAVAIKY
jgi:hypothetical protein